MKKKVVSGLTIRLAIIISVLLIATNVILGVVLVNNSRATMKSLIDNRMLDIAKTASSMLNGDVLKSLKKEDKGQPNYQEVNDILAHFQDNIDLKYIYCVTDAGNGNFVFSVDPTIEDPGEFGTPVEYTDALFTASKGSAAVDDKPYEDAWGKFYSAYSPVFDSAGNVAGIVAVDFDAEWYEAQVSKQTVIIIISSLLSVIIGIAAVIFVTGRTRRRLKEITDEIADVASDVDALTRELNPNAEIEEVEESADEVLELGRRIHQVRESLHNYTIDLHSQANSMITALSSEYRSVYYIDLDKNEGICYQPHSEITGGLKQGEHFEYLKTLKYYADKYVTDKYKDAFVNFVSPDTVRNGLDKERIITFRYMISIDGVESYEMLRMAGVRHPEDRDDHIVHAIGLGFADVDAETRATLNQSQALSDALNAAEVANKAKTAFLSNMSHEIRTPMNAIIGLDKIALNDPGVSEATRAHLEKIGTSADHLLSIINDILDMSRIEAGRMTIRSEVFSLPVLLDQVDVMIGGQCRDKGLNWNWEMLTEADEYYIGDDVKLKQVLINILGNSVKFTPEGGTITFTIERTHSYKNKSTFRFVMTDTGIGMDKDYLPKIFEPFSQEDLSTKTKYGSTGLGMPITKSIVELMNGEINVESTKGEGTTFEVTVTLTESEQELHKKGTINPQDMNVLIIDDDPVACEYAAMELEKVGVSSEFVLSGAEAVEMVKLKYARREVYNLIIVDWKMPEMDGLETTRQIRSIIGDESTIVILTSFYWEDIVEDADKAGVDRFIAKPLEAQNIIHQFEDAFALKEKNAKNKADLEGRRILLAEDMEINAEIIKEILSIRSMEVEHAEDGQIAFDMFQDSEEGYYDAVLMDMRMPNMDGLEATRAIRHLDRNDAKSIPIIALTANAFDEDVQRSLQAGLDAHLSKPVDPDNLFETLEGLVKD